MSRVLVVGDLHAPCIIDGYLKFVTRIRRKYRTDTAVLIGDIRDLSAVSFHKKNPEMPSAMEEEALAQKQLKPWYKAFPNALVMIGNHDERVCRLAADVGIPGHRLKDWNEQFASPDGWVWTPGTEIDGVYYTHKGGGGLNPAFSEAKARLQPCVMGHLHTLAAINSQAGPRGDLLWGMQVGCGVDKDHPIQQWAKGHRRKAVHACGVVIDGVPHLEFMP